MSVLMMKPESAFSAVLSCPPFFCIPSLKQEGTVEVVSTKPKKENRASTKKETKKKKPFVRHSRKSVRAPKVREEALAVAALPECNAESEELDEKCGRFAALCLQEPEYEAQEGHEPKPRRQHPKKKKNGAKKQPVSPAPKRRSSFPPFLVSASSTGTLEMMSVSSGSMGSHGSSVDATCPICLCECEPDEEVADLKCGHHACYGCLEVLLKGVDWVGGKIVLGQLNCPAGCGARIEPASKKLPFPCREKLEGLTKVADECFQFSRDFLIRKIEVPAPAAPAYDSDDDSDSDEDEEEREERRERRERKKKERDEAEKKRQEAEEKAKKGIQEGDVSEFLVKHVLLQCNDCSKVLYGGKGVCEAAGEEEKEQMKVKCPKCLYGEAASCPVHGDEHMGYKCRFCCRPATFNCSGQSAGIPGPSHFCDPCHNHGYAAPTIKCDPDNCCFNGNHPPNPVEMPLGCILCNAS